MKQDVSPNTARPLDTVAIGIVVVLCLSWGFNQVAIKLALHDIPPFIQSAARSAIAAVLVAVWARARGIKLFERDGSLRAGLLAGALFGFEFILLYRGIAWTTASRAALFIYLAPFFVVIGSRWFLPGDHFHLSQWAGLALSFVGIVIAFGVPTPAADPRQMLGDVLMVCAAAIWAATTIVIKASALNRISFEKTTLYQLVVSAPMLALAALAAGETMAGAPSAVALGAFAYQTVWVVSITYMVWFAMIVRYSASRLSAFTFLTPLFGIAAGHFVLGEPLTPAFLLAAALVAAGLVLVNRPR
jgi:drug/metabolite transporter (DMT)-like permease